VSGQKGGRGYSSGNGLLGALVLGRIAGRAAAIELRVEGSTGRSGDPL
jgi:fumarate reductase flavoprotein subunit